MVSFCTCFYHSVCSFLIDTNFLNSNVFTECNVLDLVILSWTIINKGFYAWVNKYKYALDYIATIVQFQFCSVNLKLKNHGNKRACVIHHRRVLVHFFADSRKKEHNEIVCFIFILQRDKQTLVMKPTIGIWILNIKL